MSRYVPIVGWLLVVMCSVLAVMGILSFITAGITIDLFGVAVESQTERLVWIAANLVLAVVGAVLIVWSRKARKTHRP